MSGTFLLTGVQFNNPHLQDRIDGLSARAQGEPKEVKVVSADHRTEARSQMGANFTIGGGLMTARDVRFSIPGATVLLNGIYSMDGRLFEFKGHVRTDATASAMVGGWKGFLLKPIDPFLKKNGAGLELPVEITGTEGDMHVGLAMHGTDATPREMLTDIREKQREKRELAEARREAAQADAEDARAAHATSLAGRRTGPQRRRPPPRRSPKQGQCRHKQHPGPAALKHPLSALPGETGTAPG